eukprot:6997871-Karenia_brevis.AAC.1
MWRCIGNWPGGLQNMSAKIQDKLISALCLLPLARTELLLPFDEVVTCADASLTGGAFSVSNGLTDRG